ncbi:ABC transporter permease [Pseudooceanicola onchidii]|uniref:ABC transporter permease n=1 Tax=Pseudooceanicola onchidii TaxID=2562279 RepID=UPI0010AA92AC|nr:ABC transporter permease [Pseudooceanicola onchidii]
MRSFSASRAITALMIREIATSYGRTPGGYLWAVLEPLAAVAVLAGIFSLAFDAPPLGRDFALFYASGYLPFAIYADLSQKIGVALRYSRPLMAYPAITWIDAVLARFFLNFLTHTIVVALVLGGMILWTGHRIAYPIFILSSLGSCALLGLGLGVVNAYLFERWPIWERVWAILNRPAFLASGILFLPEAIPPPFRDWIWINPLVHVITTMRSGLYEWYRPDGWVPLYPVAAALVLLALGLLMLRRGARDLLCRN